jgi:predicted nucleotidyltransferase
VVNENIIKIKDSILNTVGDNCEKIILFGSYAHGTPREGSDYDFYVVLKDETEKPILVLQKIYRQMCDTGYTPVDVLADYRNQFDWRSTQPTIERTILNTGVVLYDAVRASGV